MSAPSDAAQVGSAIGQGSPTDSALSSSGRMTQTVAMFIAAYRELNARKLFWLAIALSVLTVAAFGIFGIDEKGISVWPFGWSFESPFFNSNVVSPETFYKIMFMNLGVKFWLGIFATVLALISTAGIIPDLVGAGSVDMMLAKPISRARLFLSKYLTGLLFTALQVTVFALASFLLIGIRGKVWEPSLFLAVPFVVVFYSYLYSVCALIGLLTRSTIASLILTALFWLLLFGIHSSESIVNFGRLASSLELKAMESEMEGMKGADAEEVESLQAEIDDQRVSDARWNRVHWWLYASKTVLPKTSETLDLLERKMVADARLPRGSGDDDEDQGGRGIFGLGRVKRSEFEKASREDAETRNWGWVIGSSVLFEIAVLGLATRIFCRRDF